MYYVFISIVLVVITGIAALSVVNGIDATGLAIAATLLLAVLVLASYRASTKQENVQEIRGGKTLWPHPLPSDRDRSVFFTAMALVLYSLAAVAWMTGGRHTGRWSWLINWFYDNFGPFGPTLFFVALGSLSLVFAVLALRRHRGVHVD